MTNARVKAVPMDARRSMLGVWISPFPRAATVLYRWSSVNRMRTFGGLSNLLSPRQADRAVRIVSVAIAEAGFIGILSTALDAHRFGSYS
jgi:hypothetical protein